MRQRSNRRLFLLLTTLAVLLVSATSQVPHVSAYYCGVGADSDSTHEDIIDAAVNLLRADGYTAAYEETIAFVDELKDGVEAADAVELWEHVDHSYHPWLHCGAKGCVGLMAAGLALVWPLPLGGYIIFLGITTALCDNGAVGLAEGRFGTAVSSYTSGSKSSAYTDLGYVLHYISDVLCPAHATCVNPPEDPVTHEPLPHKLYEDYCACKGSGVIAKFNSSVKSGDGVIDGIYSFERWRDATLRLHCDDRVVRGWIDRAAHYGLDYWGLVDDDSVLDTTDSIIDGGDENENGRADYMEAAEFLIPMAVKLCAGMIVYSYNQARSSTGMSDDVDDDGLTGYDETLHGTDPYKFDTDDDGMSDGFEVQYSLEPTLAYDRDEDPDGDNLTNVQEYWIKDIFGHWTVPKYSDMSIAWDSDGDGMDDGWEFWHGLNPVMPFDRCGDLDGDELLNIEEYTLGTYPDDNDTDDDGLNDHDEIDTYKTDATISDTDADGLSDGQEVLTYGTNPNKADTDNDGLKDKGEITLGTDPKKVDTDSDGLKDGYEVYTSKSNPKLADTDGDGLTDGYEVNTSKTSPLSKDTDRDGLNDKTELTVYFTNPLMYDSDLDGYSDGCEVSKGTDPNDPLSHPTSGGGITPTPN